MKRLLLDTNIYGLIVERNEDEEFKNLVKRSDIIVYGCSAVRKELRDIPKEKTMLRGQSVRKVRNFLLNLYDTVTKEHEIVVDERTKELASKYLEYYEEITGKTVLDHFKIDFILVACASIHGLNLIVSEDHKTLMSSDAIRTYHNINVNNKINMPGLYTYEELKRLLRRSFPL